MKHEVLLPGSAQPACRAVDLLVLARQYGAAACQLRPHGRETGWGPYRFCVLHATELCLSALLLHMGHGWRDIAKMQHDLTQRANLCARHGLTLRRRSLSLLSLLSEKGAYRGARYNPASIADDLHPAQLLALFVDVAQKVSVLIARTPSAALTPPASA